MPNILILGASIMQLPALRLARQQGWGVFVADGNAGAPGIPLADRFIPVDLKNREEMAAAAAELKSREGLDGVFTAGTDFSVTVAYVAEKLNLPGIPVAVAEKASHKGLMRQEFLRAGVAIPGFTLLNGKVDPIKAVASLHYPLVVKPVDNMGSRGIQRVDSGETLVDAVEKARNHSRSGSIIVEEFIDGPEFSLDALVEDGKVTVCGFADRHIHYPPYFIEMGHTMPTSQPKEVMDAVEALFIRGIHALGITRGAAKGDIKLSSRGPVVGEIAARLSGGFMSGWTYPASSGVDLTLAAMRLALGLPAGNLRPRYQKYSAERAFISLPGRLRSIQGFNEASSASGISFGYLRISPGDRVDFPRNNVEKGGNFISRGDTREEAVALAETAAASVFLRLDPDDEATADFINRRSHLWVPDAFTPENPENLRFLEDLTRRPRSIAEAVASFPGPEKEDGRDWQGRTLRQALEMVLNLVPDLKERSDTTEGDAAGFFQAFLRGSVQGAVWYLESHDRKPGSRRGGGT